MIPIVTAVKILPLVIFRRLAVVILEVKREILRFIRLTDKGFDVVNVVSVFWEVHNEPFRSGVGGIQWLLTLAIAPVPDLLYLKYTIFIGNVKSKLEKKSR